MSGMKIDTCGLLSGSEKPSPLTEILLAFRWMKEVLCFSLYLILQGPIYTTGTGWLEANNIVFVKRLQEIIWLEAL